MEFKVKEKTIVDVKIGDKTYPVRRPKMHEQLALEEKLKSAGGTGILAIMLDWAEGLGLPKAVALDLEQESFMDMIEFLSGSKKN